MRPSLRSVARVSASLILAFISAGCRAPLSPDRNPAKPPIAAPAAADPRAAATFSDSPREAAPKKFQKWNPVWWFGNVDDPVPPDWYRPDDRRRRGKWYCRNSLHNFTFYVIGVADKKFDRVGRHSLEVFNPNDGWNWAACKYKWLRLPFISYKKRDFRFYMGWRERGNFGAKLSL